MKILLTFLLFCLVSCNILRSSINYTRGTQCLDTGDSEQAIEYLEEAVRLDPDFARNHTNLAAAYTQNGEYEKAWIHIRKSMFCKYPDKCGETSFRSFYRQWVTERGKDKLGTSCEEIVSSLGEPDMILSHGNQFVYGICIMTFKNGILGDVSFFCKVP